MYVSTLPSRLITSIDDWQGGKEYAGTFARNYESEPVGSLGFAAPFSMPLIPRSEWAERIAEREKKKLRITDLVNYKKIPAQHQGQTNYCWINCVVRAIELCRLTQGQEHIPLSPASAGAPMTGYKNVGGWPHKGVEWVAENGVVPVSLWPANAISKQHDTPESKAARPRFKIEEWIDLTPRSFEQLATLLLSPSNIPVCTAHMWMSHAICAVDLLVTGRNQFAVLFHNSGFKRDANGLTILEERLATPDSAIAPRVATAA